MVVALILVSVLVLGYSFTEVKQARVQPVVQLPFHPEAQEVGEIGIGTHLNNIERAKAVRAASLPPPEESCDDLRVLVDRSHPLPPDYVPDDLVALWAYEIPTLGGGEMLLRREAAEHLSRLVADAAAEDRQSVVAGKR